MHINSEMGFGSKRNVRECHKCGKLGKEVQDIETGRWKCQYCGALVPKRKPRNIKDKEDLREYNRKKKQEERRKRPISERKGDRKVGTMPIGEHMHEDTTKERKEIDKQFNSINRKQKTNRLKTTKESLIILGWIK